MIDNPDERSQLVATVRGLIVPVTAAMMIFVILVPMNPAVLDVLLAANITLAAVILLTTIYVSSPLEFSVFPSLLLGATLLRLVLNIASTRLILTAGADGRFIEDARYAAGHVIWSFSNFVTAGSLTVGVILFAIITVIQFVVITKGASRVSEVSARFILDAMPGKQMAIDSDLNASAITKEQAREMRDRVGREADFYGAMDGSTKFLRGDAVAGVLITMVNVLGGLYVGVVQYGWSWSESVNLFTRLTIGDGLAAQVPALIVSVSAALLVTRSASRTNLGEEVLRQIASRPIVLAIAAAFLAALMFTELPKLPLGMLGAGCAGLAWILLRRGKRAEAGGADRSVPSQPALSQDLRHLLTVEPMQIELGYALIRFVDTDRDGDLLDRIAMLRREVAAELGLLVPPISIRDNMRVAPRQYVIRIRGTKIAGGQLYPRQLLAVPTEGSAGKLTGRQAVDPATGKDAVWINPSQKSSAQRMNYAVHAPIEVLIRHLAEIVAQRAPELLSREQVARMLEGLRATAPSVVHEATGKFQVGQIQHVLQSLLRERVPIRDLESILEAMTDETAPETGADVLAEHVRKRLGRRLARRYFADDGKLWCVRLHPELERRIQSDDGDDADSAMPAQERIATMGREISSAVARGLSLLRRQGRRPVVLCAPKVRAKLHELIAATQPDVTVLGYNEVDTNEIESVAQVGNDYDSENV